MPPGEAPLSSLFAAGSLRGCMRNIGILALLVLAQGVAGCGGYDAAPLAPSPVSQPGSPPPVVTVPGLRGSVSDTAFRPVAGARVEIVDGPRAGESVTAGATGTFALAGPFSGTETVRATKAGYVSGTRAFSSSSGPYQDHHYIAFALNVVSAPANVAGDYTFTFIADSACTDLPSEARTRTYAATVTPEASSVYYPANTLFNVVLSGPAFFDSAHSGFVIGVAGNDIGMWLGDPPVVERLDPNTYLAMGGEARATVAAPVSTISAALPAEWNTASPQRRWARTTGASRGQAPRKPCANPGTIGSPCRVADPRSTSSGPHESIPQPGRLRVAGRLVRRQ